MARKARVKSTSGIYHVLVTGESDSVIFANVSDLEKYIELLSEYSDVCGFKLYAYCLMKNHVHLLINENGADISRIMKRIGTSFVYWYNNKYARQGQLFADRFKSEPVETEEDLKRVIKFIHKNPVREGLVSDCADYRYSSYCDYFTNAAVSSDMARRIFGGVQDFYEFHNGEVDDCLEISRKENVLTDAMLVDLIEREFSVIASAICDLPKSEQEAIFTAVTKRYNVPLRQLARVTNLNLSKLWRTLSKRLATENS